MPTTYEPIATANGTGSSGVVTFSSIPATYTDLVVASNIIGDANSAVRIRLNGDTTDSNYSYVLLYGNGSVAGSTYNAATQVNQFVSAVSGLWKNTAAITSVTIVMDSGNFTTGSTFTIYGIKAA